MTTEDPTINNIRGLFILDNIYIEKIHKDSNLLYLFMAGARSNNITTIITQQYFFDMPPACRVNIDYLFVFKISMNDNQLLKIWDTYCKNIFETFECFKEILNKAIDNYGCLVIENSNKPRAYFYKSQLHNDSLNITNEEEIYEHKDKRIKY